MDKYGEQLPERGFSELFTIVLSVRPSNITPVRSTASIERRPRVPLSATRYQRAFTWQYYEKYTLIVNFITYSLQAPQTATPD
jgi:hypothetical protein